MIQEKLKSYETNKAMTMPDYDLLFRFSLLETLTQQKTITKSSFLITLLIARRLMLEFNIILMVGMEI